MVESNTPRQALLGEEAGLRDDELVDLLCVSRDIRSVRQCNLADLFGCQLHFSDCVIETCTAWKPLDKSKQKKYQASRQGSCRWVERGFGGVYISLKLKRRAIGITRYNLYQCAELI